MVVESYTEACSVLLDNGSSIYAPWNQMDLCPLDSVLLLPGEEQCVQRNVASWDCWGWGENSRCGSNSRHLFPYEWCFLKYVMHSGLRSRNWLQAGYQIVGSVFRNSNACFLPDGGRGYSLHEMSYWIAPSNLGELLIIIFRTMLFHRTFWSLVLQDLPKLSWEFFKPLTDSRHWTLTHWIVPITNSLRSLCLVQGHLKTAMDTEVGQIDESTSVLEIWSVCHLQLLTIAVRFFCPVSQFRSTFSVLQSSSFRTRPWMG